MKGSTMTKRTLLFSLTGLLILATNTPLRASESHVHDKAQVQVKVKKAKKVKTTKGFAVPSIKGLTPNQLGQLKYWVIKEGKGKKPSKGQRVTVNYGGWLESGKIFDSSYSRNQPFKFTLGGRVITGWNLMVAEMNQGETLVVKIPSHLAYGGRRAGSIPPHSTLYFQIELLNFY
jgi:FKBP-type peptidyl-prolyl cis-trans isomerase FklB